MRDVDQTDLLFPKPPNHAQQFFNFACRKRCRGLVQDKESRLGSKRPCNLDKLLFGHAERSGNGAWIDGCADTLEQFACPPAARSPMNAPKKSRLLRPQRNIFSH